MTLRGPKILLPPREDVAKMRLRGRIMLYCTPLIVLCYGCMIPFQWVHLGVHAMGICALAYPLIYLYAISSVFNGAKRVEQLYQQPRNIACRGCGYDVTDLPVNIPRCPECGLSRFARKAGSPKPLAH
jgi:hypothetical protein